MWKPRRLPHSDHKHKNKGFMPKNSESSVAADGSLFLILGLYVGIDGKSQSNNTTDTSNNIQSVYIDHLLESDSCEARYSPSSPLSQVVRQPSFYRQLPMKREVQPIAVGFPRIHYTDTVIICQRVLFKQLEKDSLSACKTCIFHPSRL